MFPMISIDGRPWFAKLSIGEGKKAEIAAIDPDFESRRKPGVPDGICWSMPNHVFALVAPWKSQVESTTV